MSDMRPNSFRRLNCGFTLLEILIALALLGILATALYGTYFSLIKGRESANEGMEARRELRATLDQLRRELNSVLYSGNNKKLHFAVEDRDIFGKASSVLTFTAITAPQPGSLQVSDQVDLKYEVVEREKKLILARQAKDFYHNAEAPRYPQMENIEGFLVECRSGDKWVRSWDSAINMVLPKEIRVTLRVMEGDKVAEYSTLAAPRITQ